MSFTLDKDSLDKLKSFIDICAAKPEILHQPEFAFFRKYVQSLGGVLPEVKKMPSAEKTPAEEPITVDEVPPESDQESDLEIDEEGLLPRDEDDPKQLMGDPSKEVSEEEIDKADEIR